MDTNIQQKPCLVETPQGFSVSYNNRFLYSKYSPDRIILQTVNELSVQPGTIILCCSPLLEYGLKELSLKIPEDCLLLGCEFNKDLYNFALQNNKFLSATKNFTMLTPEELYELPVILAGPEKKVTSGFTIPSAGKYRRIVKLDFSAGVQFNKQLYEDLSKACVNALMTFWSNRVTLTKFGRLYSRNFFQNLKIIPETTPIHNFLQKIEKPIIVCGAGETLENGIKDFKEHRENYFILCADTALQPLLKHKIVPDGVFIEEAQSVISKAFIGTTNYNFHLFAGLSSIPVINHNIPKNQISFFTTIYSDAIFINELKNKNILPVINKPFGSVGLTAVYYALQFRKSTSVPVYLYGLDFSYTAGNTHTKGTLAYNSRLFTSTKIKAITNFTASYGANSEKIIDKGNITAFTTPTMKNYATLFNGIFYNTENLYDSTVNGIKLNIPYKLPQSQNQKVENTIKPESFDINYCTKVKDYFEEEKSILLHLRDLLTGTEKSKNLEEEITAIVKKREYLYLHFPDGNEFKYSQSFLNRIRTEIDRFLKIM